MGYTNYWTTKKNENIDKKFFEDAKKIINYAMWTKHIVLAESAGENEIASADEVVEENRVIFNGLGDESYETFDLDLTEGEWNFCKTAEMPYDLVVKAILLLAEEYHLLAKPFNFDGERETDENFIKAKELYNEALSQFANATEARKAIKEKVRSEFIAMIKESWTYERLTAKEKENYIKALEKVNIFGRRNQIWEVLQGVSHGFLAALDYAPTGWREPSTN